MSLADNSTINGKLLDEAEAWIVKLRSDDVSRADEEAFSTWLNTSNDHLRAFDHAYAVWETLGAVAFLPDIHTLDKQVSRSTFRESMATALQPGWWHAARGWRGGVALACVMALFAAVFTLMQPEQSPIPQRFESRIGEVVLIELADGSLVELNTSSAVDVRYSDRQRRISLLRGEAYFSVAQDNKRPFVVNFGKGTATAVGTTFNIYRQDAATAVTVTEGRVDVRESADLAVPNPEATRVGPDQQVKVGRRGVSPVRNLNTERAVAWREKTIIFKNTPLTEALNQLNRYLETPVHGDNLGGLRVSGTFSLTSPSETVEALVTAFNLSKTIHAGDNALYLSVE